MFKGPKNFCLFFLRFYLRKVNNKSINVSVWGDLASQAAINKIIFCDLMFLLHILEGTEQRKYGLYWNNNRQKLWKHEIISKLSASYSIFLGCVKHKALLIHKHHSNFSFVATLLVFVFVFCAVWILKDYDTELKQHNRNAPIFFANLAA